MINTSFSLIRITLILFFILHQITAYSQCCCRPVVPVQQFCSSGSKNFGDCDIGDNCNDIELTDGLCDSSSPGKPFVLVFIDSDSIIVRGTYPESLCDLFQQALPGNWTIEKNSIEEYEFTYIGDTRITQIEFGDDILGGPVIIMTECN